TRWPRDWSSDVCSSDLGSGFKVREAQALLNLASARQEPEMLLPLRYQRLAVQAYQDAKLSEGQLARFLRTDRIGAREILERVERSEERRVGKEWRGGVR